MFTIYLNDNFNCVSNGLDGYFDTDNVDVVKQLIEDRVDVAIKYEYCDESGVTLVLIDEGCDESGVVGYFYRKGE